MFYYYWTEKQNWKTSNLPDEVFLILSSLIKEISRLISKEMYVLLFDTFNTCSLVQLKK